MDDNNMMNQQYNSYDPNKEVMKMGDWLITLIIMAIPCVGLIMGFVWAFGNGNENRRNYARASLIMMLIGAVLLAIFYGAMGAAFISAARAM